MIPFVKPPTSGVVWKNRSKGDLARGYMDDCLNPGDGSSTWNDLLKKEQKVIYLELMLEQIANYCSVISHCTIFKNSTPNDSI